MAAPRNSSPLVGEQDLITTLLGFRYDPEGFVRYAFPWDVKQIDQTVTINLSDAMRDAQERLDRSRTVDAPVRRIE